MKRIDRFLVVGLAGILLIAVATIALLMGAGGSRNDDGGDYRRFFLLVSRLGYHPVPQFVGKPFPREAAKTFLIRAEPPSDGEKRRPPDEETLAYVRSGGVVLVAGGGGFESVLGIEGFRSVAPGRLSLAPDLLVRSVAANERSGGCAVLADKVFSLTNSRALVLASTKEGPYVISERVGLGHIIAVADDELFVDGRVLDPDVAALVNGLLATQWGKRCLFSMEGSPASSGGTSFFRLLARPGNALIAAFAFSFALVLGLSLAVRFGPLRSGPGTPRSDSSSVAETYGGFYRRSRAYKSVDGLLSAAFFRGLARSLHMPSASREELASAASSATGLAPRELVEVMADDKVNTPKKLAAREKRREAVLDALAARGDKEQ